MSTIKDVAKEAKVAISTVSNVINNSKPVKPETRNRILEAIKKVGYRHNAAAASLKSSNGGVKTIGVVGFVNENPYFSELFFELENACYESGYAMLSSFCRIEDGLDKIRDIPSLLHGRVDGIVFISTDAMQAKEFLNNTSSIPSIVICSELTDFNSNSNEFHISRSNHQGGRMAASYLFERGFSSFACITGNQSNIFNLERLNGFLDGLLEKGVNKEDVLILKDDFTFQGGFNSMMSIFSSNSRPDAVFYLNDLMALGALNAAACLGLKVPKDIAIMGYDNIKASQYTSPSLTTIEVSHKDFAQKIVEGLLSVILNQAQEVNITLTPKLKVRQST
jgi:LacI family transcriptional regulator